MNRPAVNAPDLREQGSGDAASDRRLYMQLQVFTGCLDTPAVVSAVQHSGLTAAVYEDVNDPRGVGVLVVDEDPGVFVDAAREMYQASPFASLTPRPAMTMIGRTYSIGYERDLQDTLIDRPRRRATASQWPWVVWYPLRRSGRFEQLTGEEQSAILKEHGTIGMAFGAGDYAHDIRLACQGLDQNDNDFVICVMGKALTPLSQLVQRMRKTTQTAQYLERLGPFFVGHAVYQSPTEDESKSE